MKYEDYYQTLKVGRDASQDDIKKSYRRLARKYHPDVSSEPDAEEHFKAIGEAYEVLKDRDKRAAYDQLGSNWKAGQEFTPPPGWEHMFGGGSRGAGASAGGFGGSVDFSDFFESLFGGVPGGRRGGPVRRRGPDNRITVQVSLEEAHAGSNRVVRLQNGSETRRLNVKIPAGVSDGQQIRLAGQGQPGSGGAEAGDLYLEVVVMKHPLYTVAGKNVSLDLPITPWEAALGGTVKVPTLGGVVDLKVPAGSKSGAKLRLKGRGLGQGDLYVCLQILTPPADSETAVNIYERMRDELGFDPRKDLKR